MVAHSLGHTYLYDCELTGTVALNTHNSMSPEYSYIHMFGGKLNSTAASILCAEDGKAIMNLDHVTIGDIADGNLAYAHSGGRLVANLAEMTVTGNLDREEKSYLELSLKGTTLTGSADMLRCCAWTPLLSGTSPETAALQYCPLPPAL